MKLSVIIPCKNEAGTVEQLLDSIAAQSTLPYEVIVIDSHSQDETAAVAASYKASLPIRVIRAKQKGLAHARNEGAASAKGTMLLFIDADVILPPDFIRLFLSDIRARHLSIGGFSQRMASNRRIIRVGARVMNGYVKTMSHTPWPIFFSCFFATKEMHNRIHGFDTNAWIMEDYDYAYRAHKAGARFGIVRKTHFISSDRRFQNGLFSSVIKAIYAEIYRYAHGLRVSKQLFTYTMGGQPKKKQDTQHNVS